MERTCFPLLSATLTVLVAWPGLTLGDDTEVFFSRAGATTSVNPNVLFMFDTSGSMADIVEGNLTRLDAVKQSVVDLVSTSEGVNIGIGGFAGADVGGAILYPATDLDADVCPDAGCTSIKSYYPILSSADDVVQNKDGSMDSNSDTVTVGDAFSFFPLGTSTVGLRFGNIKLPRGATIQNARLRLRASGWNDAGHSYTIQGESSGDSAPIATVNNSLASRVRTTANVSWNPDAINDGELAFANVTSIVQEVSGHTGWCGGHALTLLIEGGDVGTFRSFDLNKWQAPALEVTYDPTTVDFNNTCVSASTMASVNGSGADVLEDASTGVVTADDRLLRNSLAGLQYHIGLRFDSVNVPKDAVIVGARIELTSGGFVGSGSQMTIRGENSAMAAEFESGTAQNVTSRSRTSSSVAWNIPPTATSLQVLTPSVAPIVSSLVSRADWVQGSPMVFIFDPSSGTNEQLFNSFDENSATRPRLIVDFERTGVHLAGNKIPLRTAREEVIDTMWRLPAIGGTPLVDYLYEAALYFRGEPVDYGTTRGIQYNPWDRHNRLSHENSYTGGVLNRPSTCPEFDLDNVDCITERIDGNPIYTAPDSGMCQANSVVLLSDGEATTNSAEARVQSLTGNTSCQVRTNVSEHCGVELAQWLFDTDHDSVLSGTQNLITHTVGFTFSNDYLKDVAAAGGGQFQSASSASELTSVFRNIVTESADVDTSFVAPAVTVSQFGQLANRNDLYFAMFKPNTKTRWQGNLKKYELNIVAGETTVVDSLGMAAIDTATGTIKPAAKSFWSVDADGGSVAKGGAASRLVLPRNLYTFAAGASGAGSLQTFGSANINITDAMLGLSSPPTGYRDTLLNWASGEDINDVDGDGITNDIRNQMGDPLHSTPYIMNYKATDGTIASLVYFGTNEGFLHAVSTDDGSEVFGIIPPDLLSNLDYLYTNTGSGTAGRRYGLDGEVVGWIVDTNGNRFVDPGEEAFVMVGMRRGGRKYYVFNVSDPANPEVVGTIDHTDTGFEELGQTWSRPVRTSLRVSGTVKDVLIFSGGYDADNDSRQLRSHGDDMGRAIFIVDATSGSLLERIDSTDESAMDYSIPSTPRVIDINVDGLADYMFVGDMGGQLWRFDFNNNATGSLSSTITGGVIAEFSNSVSTMDNRRFFYEPDVALIRGDDGKEFLSLSIGSGWRSHPLDDIVEDRFYVVRDYAVFDAPRDTNGDIKYTVLAESNLFDATTADTIADTSGKSEKGFFIDLAVSGEKVLSSAVTVNSKVLFTSYMPDIVAADVCSAAVGGSRFYAIDVKNASAVLDLDGDGGVDLDDRNTYLKAPGIAPSPSVLLPEINNQSPLTLVGLEKPQGTEDLDFGRMQRRTFWGEAAGSGEFADNDTVD